MRSALDELRRRFAVPGTLDFEAGQGGLPRARITTAQASAELYLEGAHVTGYTPRGSLPCLYVSPRSSFEPGRPIRGGVPVIFPWFGTHPEPGQPQHGLARTRMWQVEGVETHADGSSTLSLRLTPDDVGDGHWPAGVTLRFSVSIGPVLSMTLEVLNDSATSVTFEEALHTYLAVGDVRAATLRGLAGTTFMDKTEGMARKRQDFEPLRFAGETDRVYLAAGSTCTVDDPVSGRRLTVDTVGSRTTVVWNPWKDRAATIADLAPDDWQRFLCVESANAADDAITLAPGGRHELTAMLRVGPR